MKTVTKTVIYHYCEFCNERYSDYDKPMCVKHELKCTRNPLAKCCITCKNLECFPLKCTAGVSGVWNKHNCKKWKIKEGIIK